MRTQILGRVDPPKEQQAQRVKDFMNHQIMNVMKEYEPEFDQMLFNLPLAGSTFKKVYFDSVIGRTVSKFVPAEETNGTIQRYFIRRYRHYNSCN